MSRFVRFQNQDEPGLYLVHPQNENASSEVEIIFVHGLMGKPTKTWLHPDTGCVFFRDLLPDQMREQLPYGRARIWSYGYPADVGFQTSQIYDFALALLQEVKDIRRGCEERRIIWVCHSLGGIVVKRALNEACGQKQYGDIFNATVGITFLGTPHQGSGTATIGQIAAGIAGAFLPGAQILNRPLLRNLERNSATLFETSNRFSSICSEFKIFTFYESRPLMGGRLVVARSSAVLNLPNETASQLVANHQSICRFKDRNDQNWRPVLNSIVNMVAITMQQIPRPMPARSPPLSGIGNQRKPAYQAYTPPQYPNNSYPNGVPYQSPTYRPAPSSSQPSHTSAPHQGRPRNVYTGMKSEWTADLPEVNRRPIPNPNSSTSVQPPRPPKEPLSDDSSIFSFSDKSSNSVNSSANPVPDTAIGSGTREKRQYPSFHATRARENSASPAVERLATTGDCEQQSYPAFNTAQAREASMSPQAQTYAGSSRRERSPYPAFNTAHARESSSPSPSETSTSTDRREVRPYPAFNSSFAREDITPTPPASSPPTVPQSEPSEETYDPTQLVAMCDVCEKNIYAPQARIQCSECYDYDLCTKCYGANKVSKLHKTSHTVRHLLKTEVCRAEDFVPPHDDVNPERSADQKITHITVEPDANRPGNELRWHHLYGTNGHLRYLTSSVEPGYYAAQVIIQPRLSDIISQAGKDELKQEGLGYLRIGLGTLENKKRFFRTQYPQESFQSLQLTEGEIIDQLLENYWWTVVKMPGDGEQISIPADGVINVDKPQDLGLIVQWSGIRNFENSNEAVVCINVADFCLYDIRDHTEPLPILPTFHPNLWSFESNQAAATDSSAQATDDGDDVITAEELLAALLQIEQSVEDARQRRQLELAIKQRLQQQEQARQAALMGILFAKIQEEARLEQERQEQEEARRFLRLMGFAI